MLTSRHGYISTLLSSFGGILWIPWASCVVGWGPICLYCFWTNNKVVSDRSLPHTNSKANGVTEIVITTTAFATSDDKVYIMTTLCFEYGRYSEHPLRCSHDFIVFCFDRVVHLFTYIFHSQFALQYHINWHHCITIRDQWLNRFTCNCKGMWSNYDTKLVPGCTLHSVFPNVHTSPLYWILLWSNSNLVYCIPIAAYLLTEN